MLKPDEVACLGYLDDKMEATGAMIGEAIAPGRAKSPRGYARIGNRVARGLCVFPHGGLTGYLPDLNAWRVTAKGREALRAARAGGNVASGSRG